MNIALIGFYGKQNFGDDLMQVHLSNVLGTKDHTVNVYSDCSSSGIQNGLKKKYLQDDIIVIGGGGIVTPEFWLFKKEYGISLIESKKPIFFVNVNVTTVLIENLEFQNYIKSLKARWWVRDTNSQNILKQIGIDSEYLPDVSFKEDVIQNNKCETKTMSVFLNSYVFNDYFGSKLDKYLLSYKNLVEISNYLDWMAHFNWHINFIPCQTEGEFDDRVIASVVYGLMKHKSKCNLIHQPLSVDDIISYIENSSLVISTRYHPVVLSAASQTKFLDLTHHDKNKMFLKDMNLENHSIDYYLFHKEKLIEKTQEIENSTMNTKKVLILKKRWKTFVYEWGEVLKSTEYKP